MTLIQEPAVCTAFIVQTPLYLRWDKSNLLIKEVKVTKKFILSHDNVSRWNKKKGEVVLMSLTYFMFWKNLRLAWIIIKKKKPPKSCNRHSRWSVQLEQCNFEYLRIF